MNYVLYKATSPSGRYYIGVTNNFKRRMKEHKTSPYGFGQAIRKYGFENFVFDFEAFTTVEEALAREAELTTPEVLKSKATYNQTVGGILSNVLIQDNPVHREGYVNSNTWTTEHNPMNNLISKQKMIESQACKKVSIDEIEYYGVREAARQLNISRQLCVHRLKSTNYPNWYYIK